MATTSPSQQPRHRSGRSWTTTAAGSSYITFASTRPRSRRRSARRRRRRCPGAGSRPPRSPPGDHQAASETTGLRCAPETGPSVRMSTLEAECRGRGVLQQLEADVVGRQPLGGDAGADDDRHQQGGAEQLGGRPAGEVGLGHAQQPVLDRRAGRGRALELGLGVREDHVVLPALAVGPGHPVLVLPGVAAHHVALHVEGDPGGLEALGLLLHLRHRRPLDAEVVEGAGLRGVGEEHQLERRVGDREVGVARAPLGGLGAEEGGVERHRLVEVVDVEGELEAGHEGSLHRGDIDECLCLASTTVDHKRLMNFYVVA